MTRLRSMNQLCTGVDFRFEMASTARSENVTGDRPGVHDRHFWLPE
jgi:hypothetical protein